MSDSFGEVNPAVKAWNRAAQKASRNAAIEECARVVESVIGLKFPRNTPQELAAAIRALKEKP